jgi:hypothetical protein
VVEEQPSTTGAPLQPLELRAGERLSLHGRAVNLAGGWGQPHVSGISQWVIGQPLCFLKLPEHQQAHRRKPANQPG